MFSSAKRASIAERGLAFFSTDRWHIPTNLWPKIAIFQRPDLIHIMDVAVSIESVLRDERALVTLLLHRDERTTVTLLLPTNSEACVSNRVKAPARRFMVSYRRALGDDTRHGKCRQKYATDAT